MAACMILLMDHQRLPCPSHMSVPGGWGHHFLPVLVQFQVGLLQLP